MPLLALLRNLFTRPRLEQDLDDELRSYLDQVTEEKRSAGMGAWRKHVEQPAWNWAVWNK